MKTILYFLIAIILFGSVASSFSFKTKKDTSILIQSIDNNANSGSLSQSAGIIENRLRDFGPEKYAVETIPERKQIKVTINNSRDLKTIESLIIQKGKLEFYETYNYKELTEILPQNNHLLSYFGGMEPKDSSTKIGCTAQSRVEKLKGYLDSLVNNHQCKFAWNLNTESSNACLYALRPEGKNGAVLNGGNIESLKFNQDSTIKQCWVEIKFKKSAIAQWSEITKRNLNNAIAIVLDNNVLSAPVVRSIIVGGDSQITGSFTLNEVKFITAIGNNGELPLNFKVVK